MDPYLTIPYPDDAPATGGDSLTTNLNLYYQSGDMAFIIIATAMVWFMVPGEFYRYVPKNLRGSYPEIDARMNSKQQGDSSS